MDHIQNSTFHGTELGGREERRRCGDTRRAMAGGRATKAGSRKQEADPLASQEALRERLYQ